MTSPVSPGPTGPVGLEGLPANQLPEWLYTMLLIRDFEEACEPLAKDGSVPGGAHQAVGQEAVAVGAIRALDPGDIVTSGHRPHHHALAKGMDVDGAMAELFGKATGVVGGRGGSMHVSDTSIGYFGGNGIVGASLGLAMGAALASKMRNDGKVALAFFGDGAANTGRTWEAVNLAVIWQLPLIAICENNQYAVETSIDRVLGGGSIVERAKGFGITALRVDGQDVGAMYRAVAAARARALAGEGPTFIEAVTYRYYGHNTGEVISYRTQEEADDWRARRDPIDRFVTALDGAGMLADGQVESLKTKARSVVEGSIEHARSAPWPTHQDGLVVGLPTKRRTGP